MSEEHHGPAVHTELDTGLACLVMLSRFHTVAASPEQIAHDHLDNGRQFGCAELLRSNNWTPTLFHCLASPNGSPHTPSPAIAASEDVPFFNISRADRVCVDALLGPSIANAYPRSWPTCLFRTDPQQQKLAVFVAEAQLLKVICAQQTADGSGSMRENKKMAMYVQVGSRGRSRDV